MRRLALLLLLILPGCFFLYPKSGPIPGVPSSASLEEARKKWPDVTQESLISGRQLFVAKCAGCHDTPDMHSVDLSEWPDVMKKMGPKSKLAEEQTELVLRFVITSQLN